MQKPTPIEAILYAAGFVLTLAVTLALCEPFSEHRLAVFLCAALLLYPVPMVVAYTRRHRNLAALAAINLGLGWTVVGWVCALAWSLYRDRPK